MEKVLAFVKHDGWRFYQSERVSFGKLSERLSRKRRQKIGKYLNFKRVASFGRVKPNYEGIRIDNSFRLVWVRPVPFTCLTLPVWCALIFQCIWLHTERTHWSYKKGKNSSLMERNTHSDWSTLKFYDTFKMNICAQIDWHHPVIQQQQQPLRIKQKHSGSNENGDQIDRLHPIFSPCCCCCCCCYRHLRCVTQTFRLLAPLRSHYVIF